MLWNQHDKRVRSGLRSDIHAQKYPLAEHGSFFGQDDPTSGTDLQDLVSNTVKRAPLIHEAAGHCLSLQQDLIHLGERGAQEQEASEGHLTPGIKKGGPLFATQ